MTKKEIEIPIDLEKLEGLSKNIQEELNEIIDVSPEGKLDGAYLENFDMRDVSNELQELQDVIEEFETLKKLLTSKKNIFDF